MQYGIMAIKIVVIILLGFLAYYLTRRSLKLLLRKSNINESFYFTSTAIIRWGVIFVVALISLQQVGIQIANIWAALSAIFLFLGVGLVASWSVICNLFCFLLLFLVKPFRIGDTIEVFDAAGGAGLKGKVLKINFMFTFLLEENEAVVIQVPNSIFFQKSIRRWQRNGESSLIDG